MAVVLHIAVGGIAELWPGTPGRCGIACQKLLEVGVSFPFVALKVENARNWEGGLSKHLEQIWLVLLQHGLQSDSLESDSAAFVFLQDLLRNASRPPGPASTQS